MNNVLQKVGGAIKTAVVDTVKGIGWFLGFTRKAEKVLAVIITDQAEAHGVLSTLAAKGARVVADGALDIAGKGLNLTSDAQTVADVNDFFQYFNGTFVPLIEKLYGQLDTAVVTE
jgi:hypothetical protein